MPLRPAAGNLISHPAVRRLGTLACLGAAVWRNRGSTLAPLCRKVTDGPAQLRRAAVGAARQWVFKPAALATGPVRVIARTRFMRGSCSSVPVAHETRPNYRLQRSARNGLRCIIQRRRARPLNLALDCSLGVSERVPYTHTQLVRRSSSCTTKKSKEK